MGEHFLPVYAAATDESGQQQGVEGLDSLVLVLGCVKDHSDAVAAVVRSSLSHLKQDAAAQIPLHCAVNVGPESEFSSKVIHVLQAHHDAHRLLPAVCLQLRRQQLTKPAKTDENHKVPRRQVEKQLTAPLHFWVMCQGVQVAHLSLTVAHRAAVWRVLNIVLAVFAKS